MQRVELRRAACALAMLWSACSFDTGPRSVPPDFAKSGSPVAAAAPKAARAGGSAAGAAGSSASASMTPAAAPASSRQPAPDAAPPTAPAVAGSAAPGTEVDAAAPENDAALDRDAAESASDAAVNDPRPDAASGITDAGAPTRPATPAPGTMFGVCVQNADCLEGLVCTGALTFATGMPATGYCTALCPWVNGSAAECPQPGSGQVRASCASGTALCLLESCERSRCPDGMRCEDSATPIGAGQVLHQYACRP